MKKRIFKFSFLLFVFLFCTYLIYVFAMNESIKVDKRIEILDLTNVDNLMIVAHPDDDYIWGGSHLIDDDYLVVCITCGVKRVRALEFKKAMDKTGDKYIMLGYPDKTNGKRNNWDLVYDDITKDLKKIIEYKNWNIIVTHNPDGEYGHIHHKMTSNIVTSLTGDNLYYFGRYYKKDDIPSDLVKISDENMEIKKNELIPIYASQKSTMKVLGHMFDYENWVSKDEF